MSAGATLPEGIIARYLTVGGATVDLRHDLDPDSRDREMGTAATCTGCAADRFEARADYVNRTATDNAARDWAQGHAEQCRAMPPTGAVS